MNSIMSTSDRKRPLYIPHAGPALLETPLLNKGSAFSHEERIFFNLEGLLPQIIETIEEQADRVYHRFELLHDDLERHIFLRTIQDTNETLFYRIITEHLKEMMPILYTPTVGRACEDFSKIYRRARGLFISYPNRHQIDDMLQNATKRNVKVIVVTDGERILGLGDQGIGGMGISIGKLSLYTACGGISPAYTLPVVLDCGTNNQHRLNDPFYMGWRHSRVTGDDYDEFIDLFIQGVKKRWPNALLQFEDFAQPNAMPLLKRYREQICCFNDDIQGTASVTLGCLLAACHASQSRLSDKRVVFVGAGSAGCGIAEQIVAQMCKEGISEAQARARIFMIDRYGLLLDNMPNLIDFQAKLAHSAHEVANWADVNQHISLLQVVEHAKPDILIGVSGQPGLFTQEVISTMAAHQPQPIIFPLSNPTSRVEAKPEDIIRWTQGKALVATGSPFAPVVFQGKEYPVAQCNNAYIFPGIGLGVVASGASRVSDEMMMAASKALAENSPLVLQHSGSLLPDLGDIQQVSKAIAFAVAQTAQSQGYALETSEEALRLLIEKLFWRPEYRDYKRTSF